jgi:hypothetical protein
MLRTALADITTPLQIWLYEVWTTLVPTICVPIDGTIATKVEAIRAHRSQLAVFDYLTAFQGLATYRGLCCAGSRFAEAFIATDRESVLSGSVLNGNGAHA